MSFVAWQGTTPKICWLFCPNKFELFNLNLLCLLLFSNASSLFCFRFLFIYFLFTLFRRFSFPPMTRVSNHQPDCDYSVAGRSWKNPINSQADCHWNAVFVRKFPCGACGVTYLLHASANGRQASQLTYIAGCPTSDLCWPNNFFLCARRRRCRVMESSQQKVFLAFS